MSDATRPTRPAGVREVARLAGVSTQTVSRVINDYPNIRSHQNADDVTDQVATSVAHHRRSNGQSNIRPHHIMHIAK